MKFLLTVMLLFIGVGCPDDTATGPVKVCTKSADQCQMGEGKLGVCMMNTDGTFHCMSQH